ncbi:MAG TPA: AMP-binding protein [Acidobacteriaceae bacterium]|nr:AMP-binding protein [Acidobacteriaceae bacterium]
MQRENLASLVADMQRHGRECAVVELRGNRHVRTSYAELATLSGRISAMLRSRGIVAGDRVVIWGNSSAEWIAAFFGCLLRAVLAVPLDAAGSAEFAERVIADTTPKLILGNTVLLSRFAGRTATVAFEEFERDLPRDPDVSIDAAVGPESPFQIVFTSGTTSEPKGIVHVHRNVLASLRPIETEIDKYCRYERLIHPLRFLHTLPLSHVFGQFMGLWIAPVLGAELHFAPNIESSRMEDILRGQRINVLVAVPRIAELLRRHLLSSDPQLATDIARFASLPAWRRWWKLRRVHRRLGWRFWALVCGGATLPAELEAFWSALAIPVIQGYGMTETAALITLNHPFKVARGTLGNVLPGREVRIGEGGEVLVRGEMLAAGTWQRGALQPRTEEWFATGDLAAQDAGGELRFMGRKGDVIVTGAGMNVHPADLEAALLRQPNVRAAAVVACEGPNGEEPVAAIISSGSDSDIAEAVHHANEGLADFQQIRRFVRWPDATLPYTSTGKLLRRQVAAWACATLKGTAGTSAPEDSLLRLIAEATGESPATSAADARLSEDLHVDSLARVQLQSMMESRLGLEVPDDVIARVQTLGELRTLVGESAGEKPREAAGRPAAVDHAATPKTITVATRAPQASEVVSYPRWPWWKPMQWIRAAFLEVIAQPLIHLLAAPRITREDSKLPNKPMLLIANHVTAYDGPLVLAALPGRLRRRVAIAMSGELLQDLRSGRGQSNALLNALAPIGYWLITGLYNVFPLPRLRGFRQSFAHAGEALDHGYSVLVFPEGHRSETGELQRFRPGIGLLAQESRVAVLPVVLTGLGEMKQRGRWFRSGRLGVHVGTPIDLGPTASAAEWTSALEIAVRTMVERARA